MKTNLGRGRTDEVVEVSKLTARGVAAIIAEAPGFYARMTRTSALLLSGEPVLDLNMILIGPGSKSDGFLCEAVELVQERKLPLLTLFAPDIASTLEPSAAKLGMASIGTLPLMVLRATSPFQPGKMCNIKRAVDQRTITIAGDLQASAFELPRESVARALDASRTKISCAETFVSSWDGEPISAMTVVRAGITAGVWTMATLPEHQRKGMGRAMLTRVLEQYHQQGVSLFYLGASEAGRPLYESVGFETIAKFSMWMLAQSQEGAA